MMKRLAAAVLFCSACVAPGFAQAPAAAPGAPSVADTVKQLEHDWADAMKTSDGDKLNQILADDWMALGYGGTGTSKQTKKSYIAEMTSSTSKLESFEFGPMDVKVLGNVAVVQGSDTEKSTMNGKDSSGKYVWTDVFVKRDGKWMAVRSQSSMVK